jgi:hypothetical protein
MPIGQERAAWNNFFGQLSIQHTNLFKSISSTVYLSQRCFESKQRSTIKAYAEKETI